MKDEVRFINRQTDQYTFELDQQEQELSISTTGHQFVLNAQDLAVLLELLQHEELYITVYQHCLYFSTSTQAYGARNQLENYVQQPYRAKATEHEDQPVVIFQTGQPLEFEARGILARDLEPGRVTFNHPVQTQGVRL